MCHRTVDYTTYGPKVWNELCLSSLVRAVMSEEGMSLIHTESELTTARHRYSRAGMCRRAPAGKFPVGMPTTDTLDELQYPVKLYGC